MYLYFCPMRPPGPGAIPTGGCIDIVAFEERFYETRIDRMVWGWVGYDRPLSPAEISEYELIAAPRDDLEVADRS